jgi:hypothetical protein
MFPTTVNVLSLLNYHNPGTNCKNKHQMHVSFPWDVGSMSDS